MRHSTLPAVQRTESVNQFWRCVEQMRAAVRSGDDPAPYLAEARQWLAIVKLASPKEAEALELELTQKAGAAPPEYENKQAAEDRHLFVVRLAWLGVPVAGLFLIAGGNFLVQYIAGLCLVGLLAFIFLL